MARRERGEEKESPNLDGGEDFLKGFEVLKESAEELPALSSLGTEEENRGERYGPGEVDWAERRGHVQGSAGDQPKAARKGEFFEPKRGRT